MSKVQDATNGVRRKATKRSTCLSRSSRKALRPTPFVQVADGLRAAIRESAALNAAIPDIGSWVFERVGTIHTVQGREAEAVIFVLGAPNPDQTGARGWAGKQPNLLNVAVTRAKEALYVIGNRNLWSTAGVFAVLDARLE